jgi:glutamate synthase (ferredoxin)
MTGGVAYFLDEGKSEPINTELVEVVSVEKGSASEKDLKSLIEAHVANTDSARGKMILEQWDTYLPKFVELVTQGAKMAAAAAAVAAEAAVPDVGKVAATAAVEERAKVGSR